MISSFVIFSFDEFNFTCGIHWSVSQDSNSEQGLVGCLSKRKEVKSLQLAVPPPLLEKSLAHQSKGAFTLAILSYTIVDP